MSRAINETIVGFLGKYGNLTVAFFSFGLGFYSLRWSMSNEGSGVDIANSALVIVNGLVNLFQSIAAFAGGRDKFEEWDDWFKSLESLLGVIILVITL